MRPSLSIWAAAVSVLMPLLLAAASVAGVEEDGFVWTRADVLRVLQGPWSRVRTPHFRVSSDHPASLDHFQLVDLEQSFQRIAERLELSAAVGDSLREHPIAFFYTQYRGYIERFAAVDAEGLSFPDYGLIVSARLPHAHEVAHVLTQVLLRPRAPQTVPLLQEGLATWLGGTVDASPEVILESALRRLRSQPARLGAYLTPRAFQRIELGEHERYATAALFCEFFVERYSLESLLQLYALLSADEAELLRRPTSAVRVQFEGATGQRWEDLENDFVAWIRVSERGGLARVPRPLRPAAGRVREENHVVRWWQEHDLIFELTTTEGSAVDAEILWGPLLRSPLRQSGGQPRWRRWGLRVGPDGAELVDHRVRRTIAVLPVSSLAQESGSRVLRLDPRILEEISAPVDVDVFVTPRFDSGVNAELRRRD
jgi:hypothetical protein